MSQNLITSSVSFYQSIYPYLFSKAKNTLPSDEGEGVCVWKGVGSVLNAQRGVPRLLWGTTVDLHLTFLSCKI